MKKLHIVVSPRGERSRSKKLGEYILSKMDGEKETLELNNENIGFLTSSLIAYNYGYAKFEDLTTEEKRIAKLQDKFVKQILSADEIIISSPIWNFSVPAILKAYFDLILKINETVTMKDGALIGLATNVKKAYIVLTKGGYYEGQAWKSIDMIEPLIRQDLAFIGITNLEVINWEGIDRVSDEENLKKFDELKMQIDSKL
ncbi:MAG: NAD(P)H-dependent oxidoreductase [Candidatus Gracilibacteria bacterium]|nr:NAD(P)H-dependent oxidoreductase [Candidatus Gracilibacteria bacterium]